MRLYEAIRRGAAMRPQIKVYPFSNGGSCAIGAAWEGSGHSANAGLDDAYHAIPGVEVLVSLGASGFGPHRLITALWTLNDVHDWSREQIADWLETDYSWVEVESGPLAVEAAVPVHEPVREPLREPVLV